MRKNSKETMKASILVIDDEPGMRSGVIRVLGPRGHIVDTAENGLKGIEMAGQRFYDIHLIDYKMPDMDGFTVMDTLKSIYPDSIQIIMTAYASYEMAVSATKKGAFDYLAKPFTPDELLVVIDKALEWRRLRVESQKLQEERERNLLELATEKSRTRAIIHCMGEGVLVINNNKEVVLWNPMLLQLFGLNEIGPGTKLDEIEKMAVLASFIQQVYYLQKDGTQVLVQELTVMDKVLLGTATLLADKGQNPLGTVIILRDITKQKKIEQLKTQFVSLVSHELRAPVSAIHGFIDTVINQSAGDDPGLYNQMLCRAKDRAENLLDLIRELLTLSRIELGGRYRQIEKCPLQEVISEVLDMLRLEIEEKGLKVELAIAPHLSLVMADKKDLAQVFTNLIVNAIKYNRPQGTIRILGDTEAHMARIIIEDTGIGMSQEESAHCFEEFYRARNKKTRAISGTGLGLSIVKGIIEAYAGRIECSSEPDKGTRFILYFPLGI